jgi:hypothetical protein
MRKLSIILIILLGSTIIFGQSYRPIRFTPDPGYININELTYGRGLGSTDMPYSKQFYGFTTTHGYQFDIYPLHINSSVMGGIGAGMVFYEEGPMFPLYLDLRYSLNFKYISPFVFGIGGLLLNIEDLKEQSMLFINAGAGAKIKINNKLAITICAGPFRQVARDDRQDTFVNLKVGVAYKPGKSKRTSRNQGLMVQR